MISELGAFDWDSVEEDVLGAVFEDMVPEPERVVLGQYYTQPLVADLVVSLAVESGDSQVLDPALGTGTFLVRTHERMTSGGGVTHSDALGRLWGVDISAFPAELAVINLCRLDLDSRDNFPRVTVRDFFDVKVGEALGVPTSKAVDGID